MSAHAFHGSCVVFLYDMYNSLYSKVGVIVHELSHALAGTVDIQLGEGVSVYGVENCKKLAKENPQLAVQNADKPEYFVESCGITLS